MAEKKNGKGLVVALVLFILVSIGLGGYIVYDKVLNKEEVKPKTEEKKVDKSKKKDNENRLSNEEAMKIGKELFEKAGSFFLSSDGVEKVEIDGTGGKTNVCYVKNNNAFTKKNCNEFTRNEDGPYGKINKEQIDLFTKNKITELILAHVIELSNGDYYRILGDRGSNISHKNDDLIIAKNDGDIVSFDLISYYDGMGEENSRITQSYVIKKEDGLWKVDRFVVPY